jgi:hypothetical protein
MEDIMNEHRIIAKAREYLIDPDNWTKGSFFDLKGASCLNGALLKAGGIENFNDLAPHREQGYSAFPEEVTKAMEIVAKLIPRRFKDYVDNSSPYKNSMLFGHPRDVRIIYSFNDAFKTGHEDIIALLDEALLLTSPKEEAVVEKLIAA